jgi:hypothetical protein
MAVVAGGPLPSREAGPFYAVAVCKFASVVDGYAAEDFSKFSGTAPAFQAVNRADHVLGGVLFQGEK